MVSEGEFEGQRGDKGAPPKRGWSFAAQRVCIAEEVGKTGRACSLFFMSCRRLAPVRPGVLGVV